MNRFLLTAAAVLFAGGTLWAQNTIRANVPFDFHVGNTVMPAGTYEVTPCSSSARTVVVRNCSQGIAVLHITQPVGTKPSEGVALLFNQYGEKYFLNQVHGIQGRGDVVLPTSALEKKVAAEQAQVRVYEKITVPGSTQPQPPK